MTIDFPSGRQTFDFDCGAKALQLVMTYYGMDVSEGELWKQLEVSSQGTPLKNMITVAEKYGFNVSARCGFTLKEIREYVDRGVPVIVLVQAWVRKPMTLEEWREDYDDGHYAIVIGHYNTIIVFEDPASYRKTWMTDKEFMARWHDRDPATNTRLEHFAMVLLGKEPAPQHRMMEHMD
jgi:predicted double-glycine peptidase